MPKRMKPNYTYVLCLEFFLIWRANLITFKSKALYIITILLLPYVCRNHNRPHACPCVHVQICRAHVQREVRRAVLSPARRCGAIL